MVTVLAPAALPEEAAHAAGATVVGECVHEGTEGVLRGHGVQQRDDLLVATVCGLVQRVNKLVTVAAWAHRYRPEVGDVVVGRVTQAAGKRWRVDLGAQVEAALLLSAVNLPGGVQRRRTAEDELNMRAVFAEGDLLTSEVQALHHDGSIMLHTRSSKYGRLGGGVAVAVPPALVRRQKQHFVALEGTGADIVLGCNGVVWVAPAAAARQQQQQMARSSGAEQQQQPQKPLSSEQAEATSRVAQAVRVLAACHCAITPPAIQAVLTLAQGLPPARMLAPDFCQQVVAAAEAAQGGSGLEAME